MLPGNYFKGNVKKSSITSVLISLVMPGFYHFPERKKKQRNGKIPVVSERINSWTYNTRLVAHVVSKIYSTMN